MASSGGSSRKGQIRDQRREVVLAPNVQALSHGGATALEQGNGASSSSNSSICQIHDQRKKTSLIPATF